MEDLNNILKTFMGDDALEGISKLSGVSGKEVKSVLSEALPSLLKGVSNQTNKDNIEGFTKAVVEHGDVDLSDIKNFMKKIDVEDGGKIINHLLGDKKTEATTKAAKAAGLKTDDVSKVISTAAPLLMSLVGKQAKKTNYDNVTSTIGSLLSGVDLSGLAKLNNKD